MSYGLQVWNQGGVKVVDTSDRFFRVVQNGSTYLGQSQAIDIYIPNIQNNGNWLVHIRLLDTESTTSVVINTGYITITNDYQPGTVYYTVFTL